MQWVFCGLEKKNSPRCVNICPSIHNLWNTSRDGIFFSDQRIIQQLDSFCHVTFWSSQLPWNPGLINLWTCKIFDIKHQDQVRPACMFLSCITYIKSMKSLCKLVLWIWWVWMKHKNSVLVTRRAPVSDSRALPLTLLLLLAVLAATAPVSDRPTATASCNSIAVQHFRASLFLLLFTLSYFFSLYFLSLNGFYCIRLKWTFAVLSDFMSIQSLVSTYNVLSKDML